MITDIIIVAVLLLIVGGAGFYVYKAKKSGKKCIGCPDSGSCSCGCGDKTKNTSGCCGECSGCGSAK